MRRRILLTLLASTSIVLVAFLAPLMVVIGDVAADRAQRQVVLEVQPLVSRIPAVPTDQIAQLVASYREQTSRKTTVYLPDSTIIGDPRPMDPGVTLARESGAFFTNAPGGRDLLVPVYTASGEAVLRVFVPQVELTGQVGHARLILVCLGVLLMALSVGLGLLLARSFLRPIEELSDTAERLATGDLQARLVPSEIPELAGAGNQLNRLAGRVTELLSLQREEVADLAHRLRTPVAALRLDVDTLPEQESAGRLRADLDQLERMVDEVIREARRPLRDQSGVYADLGSVVADRAAFWAVLAEDQGREMTVDVLRRPMLVAVDGRDLGDAVDALLGNVFAHTPEDCAFHISTGVVGTDATWVEIADHGPGFPRADVLARGESVAGSTGLGLDIASRLAQRGGGQITLGATPGGGATVRLTLAYHSKIDSASD